jgi:hypothetical protein
VKSMDATWTKTYARDVCIVGRGICRMTSAVAKILKNTLITARPLWSYCNPFHEL